jgi:ABC-type branched-subunit amino acid transport system permease subunit
MGRNGVQIILLSVLVPIRAATGMCVSLTVTFAGTFLVSLLLGLAADLTGYCGSSSLGLAGRAAVGAVLGLLAREPGEGAKP